MNFFFDPSKITKRSICSCHAVCSSSSVSSPHLGPGQISDPNEPVRHVSNGRPFEESNRSRIWPALPQHGRWLGGFALIEQSLLSKVRDGDHEKGQRLRNQKSEPYQGRGSSSERNMSSRPIPSLPRQNCMQLEYDAIASFWETIRKELKNVKSGLKCVIFVPHKRVELVWLSWSHD
jgi:hypothetical protein